MAKEDAITAEYVRQIFDYDPETGILRWRSRPEMKKEWNTKFAGKVAGYKSEANRIVLSINNVRFLAHRVIWLLVTGQWPKHEVDHADLNGSNNRWLNLREATRAENEVNKPGHKGTKTGVKGVTVAKKGKPYQAQIGHAGKVIHLGTFNTLAEAVEARRAAAEKLHGRFVRQA